MSQIGGRRARKPRASSKSSEIARTSPLQQKEDNEKHSLPASAAITREIWPGSILRGQVKLKEIRMMNELGLFTLALGLSKPWQVVYLKFSKEEGRLDLWPTK